jgi:hypothetical protein
MAHQARIQIMVEMAEMALRVQLPEPLHFMVEAAEDPLTLAQEMKETEDKVEAEMAVMGLAEETFQIRE